MCQTGETGGFVETRGRRWRARAAVSGPSSRHADMVPVFWTGRPGGFHRGPGRGFTSEARAQAAASEARREPESVQATLACCELHASRVSLRKRPGEDGLGEGFSGSPGHKRAEAHEAKTGELMVERDLPVRVRALSRRERARRIAPGGAQSLSRPWPRVGVSRSSQYGRPKGVGTDNAALTRRMDEPHMEVPGHGSRPAMRGLHVERFYAAPSPDHRAAAERDVRNRLSVPRSAPLQP